MELFANIFFQNSILVFYFLAVRPARASYRPIINQHNYTIISKESVPSSGKCGDGVTEVATLGRAWEQSPVTAAAGLDWGTEANMDI